jgi:glycosyltransferase involved in cell wall biosynthesis
MSKPRIGWITDTFPLRPSRRSVWLKSGAMLTMRCRNIMLALNGQGFQNSFYDPLQNYEAVMVVKTFQQAVLQEVNRLKDRGTPVIFDSNVNYYYLWGDYTDPRTRPRPDEHRAALQITRLADYVIADSEYLRQVARDFNPRTAWIPDNVAPWLFRPAKHQGQAGKLRLIWSGVSFKSGELLLIKEVLASIPGLELWLVSEQEPSVYRELGAVLPTRWFKYSDWTYPWYLGRADVIISPRSLNNGYNLGHTEYKISLGMARNLPALASPQPSYVMAIGHLGGGVICYTLEDWAAALAHLRDDPAERLHLGALARQTVEDRYLSPVVAGQVRAVLESVLR